MGYNMMKGEEYQESNESRAEYDEEEDGKRGGRVWIGEIAYRS